MCTFALCFVEKIVSQENVKSYKTIIKCTQS